MDILDHRKTSPKRVVNDMSLEIKVRGAREKRLQLDNGHKIVSCYYHIVTMLLSDDFDVLLIIIYMILHLYIAFKFMKNTSRHLPYVEDYRILLLKNVGVSWGRCCQLRWCHGENNFPLCCQHIALVKVDFMFLSYLAAKL